MLPNQLDEMNLNDITMNLLSPHTIKQSQSIVMVRLNSCPDRIDSVLIFVSSTIIASKLVLSSKMLYCEINTVSAINVVISLAYSE